MKCDVCHKEIKNKYYDAKTVYGPWANLCPDCFEELGVGLGTGLGQEYTKKKGVYIKTQG